MASADSLGIVFNSLNSMKKRFKSIHMWRLARALRSSGMGFAKNFKRAIFTYTVHWRYRLFTLPAVPLANTQQVMPEYNSCRMSLKR